VPDCVRLRVRVVCGITLRYRVRDLTYCDSFARCWTLDTRRCVAAVARAWHAIFVDVSSPCSTAMGGTANVGAGRHVIHFGSLARVRRQERRERRRA